jgi:hypothetical protein
LDARSTQSVVLCKTYVHDPEEHMTLRVFAAVLFGLFITGSDLLAQTRSITLSVKETAGIRRNAYPVNARVPLARGVLKDPGTVRVMNNDREVAAQISAESRWPDESIQSVAVDFNVSIAPREQQTYRLEYGADVKPGATPRGLAVTQTDDAIQVGNVRFNKSKAPLVLSVRYRQEDIGTGANGFTITDSKGRALDLMNAESMKAEVIKTGPLYVVVRYSGKLALDSAYGVGFTVTAEMPNSKTWVKYSASVDDPAKRVQHLTFNQPLAFSTFPWLWDFGTGSWSYGSFRNPTDSVVFTQTVKAGGNDWQIKTGPKGQEQMYEVAGGNRPKLAEGWGHIQDAKEVIAFGFDKFGRQPGTYTASFDGLGQTSFRFVPAQPGTRHEMTVYFHYVASPTPIGAVTSPVSMLYPLVVEAIVPKN